MANIKQIKLNNTTYDIAANSLATSGTTNQFWRGDNTWADLPEQLFERGTGENSVLVINTSSPNTASGDSSLAVGQSAEASGKQSIAMGDRVKASGFGTVSIGGKVSGIDATQATSTGAIAIGASCCSSGMYAISIGYLTTASGMAALALGAQNEAQGIASFTAGRAGIAKGNYASTIGYNLIASGEDSLVCGKYNIADETNETANNTYAMIVGNGTSAEARSNAMTVDWAGNVNAQNSLSVANSVSMVYNTTTNALDFVFA